jgi:hypothetical protein
MNPIPLRHGRRIYAYACGRCHTPGDKGAECWTYDPADRDAAQRRWADLSRHSAERCCRCSACGEVLPEGRRCGDCPACEAKRRALVEEHRAAAHRLDVCIAEARGARSGEAALRLREAITRYATDYRDDYEEEGDWPETLAFDLWRDASGGGHPALDAFAALAREAGGWWCRRRGEHDPAFFPTSEWLAMVAAESRGPDPSAGGGKVTG